MAQAQDPGAGWLAKRFLVPLEARPLGAFWLWAVLTVGMLGLYLAWHALTGPHPWMYDERYPLHITPHNATHLTVAMLIAFLLATIRYERRRGPAELEGLRSVTQLSGPAFGATIATAPGHQKRLRTARGLGAMAGVAVISAAAQDPAFLFRKETWDLHFLWNLLSMMLLFALLAGSVFDTLAERRRILAIAAGISRIDLLDTSALQPLWVPGLRHASYFMIGSILASPLATYVDRGSSVGVVVLVVMVVATIAFLGPARAIRPMLIQAKRDELARVRARITGARQAALDPESPLDGTGAAALPGLLAYEARIERVGEWPFGTPTLLRFAALLALATGSWVGGAVVERVIGTVLD